MGAIEPRPTVLTESVGAGLTVSGALPTVNATEECVGAEMVPITYGFDVSSLGLAQNDDLRLNLLVTFAPASGRSSCSLDADCDGSVDESGGEPVVNRTVQHRLRFAAPACN